MKFELKGLAKENIYNLMRRMGYYFQKKDEEKGEIAFVRPARGFPRFHLFLKIKGEDLICNLHLDQKAPIYKGTPAHAREYEKGAVESEAERIKRLLSK